MMYAAASVLLSFCLLPILPGDGSPFNVKAVCISVFHLPGRFTSAGRCSSTYYQCFVGFYVSSGFYVKSKECGPGTVWDQSVLKCVLPNQSTEGCTPQSLCRPHHLPYLITDPNSCDRFTYCSWIFPTAKYTCCPTNLVWSQEAYACIHPTAAHVGCTRLCNPTQQ